MLPHNCTIKESKRLKILTYLHCSSVNFTQNRTAYIYIKHKIDGFFLKTYYEL